MSWRQSQFLAIARHRDCVKYALKSSAIVNNFSLSQNEGTKSHFYIVDARSPCLCIRRICVNVFHNMNIEWLIKMWPVRRCLLSIFAHYYGIVPVKYSFVLAFWPKGGKTINCLLLGCNNALDSAYYYFSRVCGTSDTRIGWHSRNWFLCWPHSSSCHILISPSSTQIVIYSSFSRFGMFIVCFVVQLNFNLNWCVLKALIERNVIVLIPLSSAFDWILPHCYSICNYHQMNVAFVSQPQAANLRWKRKLCFIETYNTKLIPRKRNLGTVCTFSPNTFVMCLQYFHYISYMSKYSSKSQQ